MPTISFVVLTKDSPYACKLIDYLVAHIDTKDEILLLDESNDTSCYDQYRGNVQFRLVNGKLGHDFAEYRNTILPHCTKEYILFLDSDELLTDYFTANIRDYLDRTQPDLVWLPRRNQITNSPKGNVDFFSWPDYQSRVIRRSSGLKWSGVTHEQIKPEVLSRVEYLPAFERWAIIHSKTLQKANRDKQRTFDNYSKEELRGIGEGFYDALNYSSQFGEDKWIDQNIKLPADGFYVDIGAATPNNISNTFFLRQKGWKGIQIDANPDYKDVWAKEGHNLTVGIIWTEDFAPFQFNPSNPDIAKIDKDGVRMPAIKINDWFAANNVTNIDLLNIDIEGAEYDVLATLDWDKYSPKIIIFEFNTMGAIDNRLCDYLKGKGYREAHKTFANYIYVKD